MSKINPEHLVRSAYVYMRQSTADQLRNNHESRRRQYALADRARLLGWTEVVVIDDALGVSACGVARPGFERHLAAICSGQVGAVVSIEASRLSSCQAASCVEVLQVTELAAGHEVALDILYAGFDLAGAGPALSRPPR